MNTKIYWYINDKYLGLTKDIHEFEILPGEGKHKITIVDEFGNELTRLISISE